MGGSASGQAGGEGTVVLAIGPSPAGAAKAWAGNARAVLDAVGAKPEKLPFRLPAETLCRMRDVLSTMTPPDALTDDEPFSLVLSLDPDDLREMLTYWFNLTKLTGDQQARLGIVLENPAGRAYGDALGGAVGAAMVAHPGLAEFAERLARRWEECQPAFAAAAAPAE